MQRSLRLTYISMLCTLHRSLPTTRQDKCNHLDTRHGSGLKQLSHANLYHLSNAQMPKRSLGIMRKLLTHGVQRAARSMLQAIRHTRHVRAAAADDAPMVVWVAPRRFSNAHLEGFAATQNRGCNRSGAKNLWRGQIPCIVIAYSMHAERSTQPQCVHVYPVNVCKRALQPSYSLRN